MWEVMQPPAGGAGPSRPPPMPAAGVVVAPWHTEGPGDAAAVAAQARGRRPSAGGASSRSSARSGSARSGSTGPSGNHRVNGCFKKAPAARERFGDRGPKPPIAPSAAGGGYPGGGPGAPRIGSQGPPHSGAPPSAAGGYPGAAARCRSSGPATGGGPRASSAERRSVGSAGSGGRASSATPSGGGRNIIADNRAAAANAAQRRPSTDGSEARPFSRDGGNVPKYLQRIRKVIREEEALVAQKMGLNAGNNDGAPPGCKLLPEADRLETLSQLTRRQKELQALHQKLPLKIETAGQRQRALELDRELCTVEEGLKAFSRPKVFVRQ